MPNQASTRLESHTQGPVPIQKAPDTIRCPGCHGNQDVIVDRLRHAQIGIGRAFFGFYLCRTCDRKFWQLGPAILIPAIYAVGIFVLTAIHYVRSAM